MFKSFLSLVCTLGRNLSPLSFLLISAQPADLFSRTRLGRPARPGPTPRLPPRSVGPNRPIEIAASLLSLTRGTHPSAPSSSTAERFLRSDVQRAPAFSASRNRARFRPTVPESLARTPRPL